MVNLIINLIQNFFTRYRKINYTNIINELYFFMSGFCWFTANFKTVKRLIQIVQNQSIF